MRSVAADGGVDSSEFKMRKNFVYNAYMICADTESNFRLSSRYFPLEHLVCWPIFFGDVLMLLTWCCWVSEGAEMRRFQHSGR